MNDSSYARVNADEAALACHKIIKHVERIRREDIAKMVADFRTRRHRILRWRRKWTDEQITNWLDLSFIKVKFWRYEQDAKALMLLCQAAIDHGDTDSVLVSTKDAELLNFVWK